MILEFEASGSQKAVTIDTRASHQRGVYGQWWWQPGGTAFGDTKSTVAILSLGGYHSSGF